MFAIRWNRPWMDSVAYATGPGINDFSSKIEQAKLFPSLNDALTWLQLAVLAAVRTDADVHYNSGLELVRVESTQPLPVYTAVEIA